MKSYFKSEAWKRDLEKKLSNRDDHIVCRDPLNRGPSDVARKRDQIGLSDVTTSVIYFCHYSYNFQ
jgi:hypothetical protein